MTSLIHQLVKEGTATTDSIDLTDLRYMAEVLLIDFNIYDSQVIIKAENNKVKITLCKTQ
jgi:hypothetical protein